MKPAKLVAGASALVFMTTFVLESRAQSLARDRDRDEASEAREQAGDSAEGKNKDPIRGSTLVFDQAMSTQTAHLDPSPQLSYVPFYQWWISFRPRYNFNDKLRLQARFDYYKEFTNSQNTTYEHEDVFGDIWTDLVYTTPLATYGRWKNTKVSAGLRALWPTSKASQGQGTYVALGATGGISQKVPLRGEDAPVLNSARFGLSLVYLHPFTSATTPNSFDNFGYVRQDVDGYSFTSHQLTGQPIVNHTLYAILDSGLQITPKMGFSLDLIWINQWHYAAGDATISGLTGPIHVATSPDDQQFTQLFWFLTSVDYELFDEVSLGLGYYNLANVISPDGTLRGPFYGGQDSVFWSPDANIFFDVTANLDRIFEDATGRYKLGRPQSGQTASAARDARRARLMGP